LLQASIDPSIGDSRESFTIWLSVPEFRGWRGAHLWNAKTEIVVHAIPSRKTI